ncbi:TetR/AcrR family transcriptional regulator, partial [Rothia dentocariosa]|uniref:TetR/AcrR family transcriptional regulator n=1 Tax=Rothia dentocariosa TaxID=2047 RepID=UPI001C54CA43
MAEPQRRERKKRQTRDALVHAALRLFDAKGYEHTAVREITDAVDVSERTFFRYFANKEDLALSFISDSTDAFIRELALRPAAEPRSTEHANSFRASRRSSPAR